MLIKLIVGSALIAAPHWLHAATACEDKAAGGQYAYVVKTSNVDDGRSEGQDVVVKRAKVVVGEAVQPEYAITVDGQNQAPARVIINGAAIDSDNSVFVGEDGTVEHVKVFEMKSADGQPGSMMVKVLGGDGATSHVELAQAVNRKGGWLGVSIKGAAEDSGVEVLNVIKDSPAEEAGLLAGDVILEVDGDEVANDVPLAVSAISSHEPGDEVEVVVLRDGRERSFDVVLGSRKDIKNFEWKFDTAPFAEIEENVAIKGKMLLKDEDGEWVFKSLDNLEQIEDIHN
ncbi:MAG: S1C family serine protease, partial [Phycisphaerae bacterium]